MLYSNIYILYLLYTTNKKIDTMNFQVTTTIKISHKGEEQTIILEGPNPTEKQIEDKILYGHESIAETCSDEEFVELLAQIKERVAPAHQ